MSEKNVILLGTTLHEIRRLKEISPEMVLAETGVSNEYLRRLEAGEITNPSPSVLYKLANFYETGLKPFLILAGCIVKK